MQISHFGGRVGNDADLKYTQNGLAICTFSLALDNGKDKAGNKRAAIWVKVQIWDKRGEALATYITKGKYVIVTGTVSAEAWVDKQSGDAKSKLVLNCREFEFGGGGGNHDESSDAGAESQERPASRRHEQSAEITDEDIPF